MENKVDFAIISDHSYVNGGLANIAITQAISLVESGYRVLFISGSREVDPNLLKSGVIVETIGDGDFLNYKNRFKGAFAGLFSFKVLFLLFSLNKKYSFRSTKFLLHGWSKCFSPSLFFGFRLLKINVYAWNHDYFLVCPNGGLFNYTSRKICSLKPGGYSCLMVNCDSRSIAMKIYRFIRFLILRATFFDSVVEKYIVIGETNKKVISRFFKSNKIEQIDNFIDIPLLVNSITENYVVVIGRPSPEKGLHEMFSLLRELKFNGLIKIVGSEADNYKNINLDGLNVEFTGWVSKSLVAEILSKSKFLIFPSLWYEGAPLVVQEAIAFGVPVLCAETNSGSDYVRKYNSGIVYNPYSIESFRSSLKKMLNIEDLSTYRSNSLKNFYINPPTKNKHIKRLIDVVMIDH